MAAADTVKKVLRLKLKLKESADLNTVLKTLKKLQELDITLDILAETGIGKTVNSFRRHKDAGDVAKSLVNKWKKLVPNESANIAQDSDTFGKEKHKRKETSGREDGIKHQKISQKLERSVKDPCRNLDSESELSNRSSGKMHDSHKLDVSKKHNSGKKDSRSKVNQTVESFDNKPGMDKYKFDPENNNTTCLESKGKESKGHVKNKGGDSAKWVSVENSKNRNGGERTELCNERQSSRVKGKTRHCSEANEMAMVNKQSDREFEKPMESFEACLNYDMKTVKRKKKPCEDKSKKAKASDERGASPLKASGDMTSCKVEQQHVKVSPGSVMDLLNVPLPTSLLSCEDLSSFSYFEKKPELEVLNVYEEVPVFTGQRLNRKMQVYSGSKITYLPTMMTLYQQCIRTLQNNIDLLYEVGGVPFDILEPVLERCTPDQLLRIEEFNPAYIGVSDHLWERHCQRDFRNEKLQEYESWREMHLRLSQEREKKLKRLTKSIVSAHSGKPKGRQVKLAYINSVAKPPRDVRIQQELHGTAGPLPVPYATDKTSIKPPDGKTRPGFSEFTRSSSSSQGQDPRKIRRVAPMMAKSLRAFKKQLCRR